MRHARAFAFWSILLVSAGIARAEQKLIVGNQYDFSFGETTQVGASSFQKGLAPFYGFYPSVDVKSIGHRTVLDMSYTALAERYEGDQKLNSLSHVAVADFSAQASRRLKLDFRGSFSSAPDYTTVDVLKGAVPATDTFRFVFQPAIGKSTIQTYHGGIGAEFDLNYRSYLTAAYSASWLNYQQSGTAIGLLVDQRRDEARFGYWYRLDPHQSIDVQYVLTTNNYTGIGSERTQAAVIGFTRQFSPSLQMHFDAGPAYVTKFSGFPSYYGYVAAASLMRKIRSSQFSAYYSHTPGDSSGLGALSNMHSGGIAIFSPLWRRLTINSSVSGFWAHGAENSLNSYKGGYGTLQFAYPLSSRWFLTWGGSYGLNAYDPINQEFKRLYMSIRFRAPEFWRTSL